MPLRQFNSADGHGSELWFDPAHIFYMTWYPEQRPPCTAVTIVDPTSGSTAYLTVRHSPQDILAPGPE